MLYRFFPSALRLRAKGEGFADLEPEALAVPKEWCPNPAATISLLSSPERQFNVTVNPRRIHHRSRYLRYRS